MQLIITEDYTREIRELIRSIVPPEWAVVYLPEASETELAAALILCSGSMGAPRSLLDRLPALRVIQHLGIGMDKIDHTICEQRHITVARLAASNAISVAEHAVMMILAALRRLPDQDRSVREGRWDKERVRTYARLLYRKRVGIVGLGAIGRAVAQRLAGFEVDIVCFDPAPQSTPPGVRCVDLDELFATSDVVTLHCPLDDSTRHLVNAGRLARMKRTAVLVNCARGGVVDQAALEAALRENRILGAALDTLAAEPPGVLPLFDCANAVFTPHAAASTFDNFGYVMARAVSNLRDFFEGRPLPPDDIVADRR